jgi:hypothetical protein
MTRIMKLRSYRHSQSFEQLTLPQPRRARWWWGRLCQKWGRVSPPALKVKSAACVFGLGSWFSLTVSFIGPEFEATRCAASLAPMALEFGGLFF